jgi:hypothetical protein
MLAIIQPTNRIKIALPRVSRDEPKSGPRVEIKEFQSPDCANIGSDRDSMVTSAMVIMMF